MDCSEAPPLRQPPRHNLVKCPLELAAGFPVDHPPRNHGVGAGGSAFFRWVDVHAAEQLGLVVIEHCVVERDVTGDLILVAGQVLAVVLKRHVSWWPPPQLAVFRPQSLARVHHRGIVNVDIAFAYRSEVMPGREIQAIGM